MLKDYIPSNNMDRRKIMFKLRALKTKMHSPEMIKLQKHSVAL